MSCVILPSVVQDLSPTFLCWSCCVYCLLFYCSLRVFRVAVRVCSTYVRVTPSIPHNYNSLQPKNSDVGSFIAIIVVIFLCSCCYSLLTDELNVSLCRKNSKEWFCFQFQARMGASRIASADRRHYQSGFLNLLEKLMHVILVF